MWIILFNALDDFGVKEINNRSVESNNTRIEDVKRKVLEEALHGALRIAGLVRSILVPIVLLLTPMYGLQAAVLTSNGYLVNFFVLTRP